MERYKYKSHMLTEEKLMVAAVRVAESWKKKCTLILKDFGLTYAQYNVLRTLQVSEDGINTIKNVSMAMLVSGANLTGVTQRMEKKGVLIRRPDPRDERRKYLEITPRGLLTVEKFSSDKDRLVEHLLKDIPESQREEMLFALKKIMRAIASFKPGM